jgi:hypothetical protein
MLRTRQAITENRFMFRFGVALLASWMVMEISTLVLATIAQGAGASSPKMKMMASAPDGVDAIPIVSDVPRATYAQPPKHGGGG